MSDDSKDVDVIREPVCFICKWYIYWPFCMAFPGNSGIPMDIRNGENNHSKPIEGDNGFKYERFKKVNESSPEKEVEKNE